VDPGAAGDAIEAMPTAQKLKIILWAKKMHLLGSVDVFQLDHLNPSFVDAYGLNPDEIRSLEGAVKAAKDRLAAIAIASAQQVSAPGDAKLVITVAPNPAEGGPVYDKLLGAFSQVMGPERMDAFNQLSAGSFDGSSLDDSQFGLAATKYEMSPTDQTLAGDKTLYSIVVTRAYPSGNSTSSSTLTLDQIPTFYPVLAHFIPANNSAGQGPN
jgi:hypothetical protein